MNDVQENGTNGAKINLQVLSPREREVYGRIIKGQSSHQISEALDISQKTVESHRGHINRKLGCRSPFEILHRSLTEGAITVADLT